MKPKEITINEFFEHYAYALSITGMAARLGIDTQQLHDQLAGKKYPEPDQLQALENAIREVGVELLAIQIVTPEYKIGQAEGFEGLIRRAASYVPPDDRPNHPARYKPAEVKQRPGPKTKGK